MGIKKIDTQYKQKNNGNFFHGYLKKGDYFILCRKRSRKHRKYYICGPVIYNYIE